MYVPNVKFLTLNYDRVQQHPQKCYSEWHHGITVEITESKSLTNRCGPNLTNQYVECDKSTPLPYMEKRF